MIPIQLHLWLRNHWAALQNFEWPKLKYDVIYNWKKGNYFKNIAVVIIGYASLQIPVVIIVLIFNKRDLIAIKGA